MKHNNCLDAFDTFGSRDAILYNVKLNSYQHRILNISYTIHDVEIRYILSHCMLFGCKK